MKILVTGGAGFIGSNVVDAYINAGHEVAVIDNLYSGRLANLNPKAKFFLMDIRSADVAKIFATEKFDLINHHAAQKSVPFSMEDPGFDADVNVKGFLNLLEGAIKNQVKKVIFISSGGAIYGEAKEYPTSEFSPPIPLSPYAIAKAASEQYLAFYHHQYGLDYTVLRYANIYGPRQIPHGEAGVVAIFMDRLLNNQPCTVFHLPDEPRGMARDYCYVDDVVQANLLALAHGSDEVCNIGTTVATTTLALFKVIYETVKEVRPGLDKSLRSPAMGAALAGDLTRSCLKVDKAKQILGFAAAHDLKAGLKKTLQWRLGISGR